MKGDSRFGFIITFPAIILILLILFFPFIYSFYISLYKTEFIKLKEFIGFSGYIDLIKDPSFYKALTTSLIFTLSCTGLTFLVGLGLAMWINRLNVFFKTLTQIIVLVPWIISIVVGTLLWRWMCMGEVGLVDYILRFLGLKPIAALENPVSAMITLILFNSWRTVAFVMVLLLAALKSIPENLYEAAEVDGASSFRKFWFITLPLLAPQILVTLVIITLSNFNEINAPLTLTGGGPGMSTTVLPILLYNKAFIHYEIGTASVITFVMSVISVIFIILYTKIIKEYYK